MATPLITRVRLKLQKIRRDLDPLEREFRQIWPHIDSVEGWLYPEEGRWLFGAARSLPNRSNIVEIGSFKGRSTCCLAFACRGTKKRIFAVDTFDGGPDLQRHDSFREFCLNIERCELSEYVEPIRGISWEIAKTWNKPIHLLFIDGSHIYEDVMADFASFFPHVVPGGLVAFHDVQQSFPDVLKAWNETFNPRLTRTGHCASVAHGTKPKE